MLFGCTRAICEMKVDPEAGAIAATAEKIFRLATAAPLPKKNSAKPA